MPNDYFEFKQFRVSQALSGMKVTTEGCLFGAIIDAGSTRNLLDIGAGTGLLGLMLAQRISALIDCVEIDVGAAKDLAENIEASPWANRITAYHEAIQNYALRPELVYDTIVSNPPFFENHLPSKNAKRQQALHQDTLSMETLVDIAQGLLQRTGHFWVLYPTHESLLFNRLAIKKGFCLNRQWDIFHKRGDQKIWRQISCFNFIEQPSLVETLAIREESGSYTPEFQELLGPYYFYL